MGTGKGLSPARQATATTGNTNRLGHGRWQGSTSNPPLSPQLSSGPQFCPGLNKNGGGDDEAQMWLQGLWHS
jgi:hypothetical protein